MRNIIYSIFFQVLSFILFISRLFFLLLCLTIFFYFLIWHHIDHQCLKKRQNFGWACQIKELVFRRINSFFSIFVCYLTLYLKCSIIWIYNFINNITLQISIFSSKYFFPFPLNTQMFKKMILFFNKYFSILFSLIVLIFISPVRGFVVRVTRLILWRLFYVFSIGQCQYKKYECPSLLPNTTLVMLVEPATQSRAKQELLSIYRRSIKLNQLLDYTHMYYYISIHVIILILKYICFYAINIYLIVNSFHDVNAISPRQKAFLAWKELCLVLTHVLL